MNSSSGLVQSSSGHFTVYPFSICHSLLPSDNQSVLDGQKGVLVGRHVDRGAGVDMAGERHTVATHRHNAPDLKGDEWVWCGVSQGSSPLDMLTADINNIQ